MNYDIVGICETHLKDNQSIHLEGYRWIGSNRQHISNKAWRGSGGIGFLIRNSVFNNFDIDILDNSRDDILWVNLNRKNDTNLVIRICICYLQPERSSRGNISQEFYDHLLSQMYLYSTGDPILICGDFNGRIVDEKYLIDSINHLPTRHNIDTQRNAFGDHLLDFLKDSNCCVLNGRGSSIKDNFTYVSIMGRSVVDYMITPYADLKKFSDFEVLLMNDLLLKYNIDLHPNSRIPDHSVLTCTFCYS